MKFISLTGVLATFLVLIMSSFSARAAESKFVEIRRPFANVYEYLDPKSAIIKQAKKGDHFELVYEGTSWYQVKISEKVGWLEKRAGNIVENSGYLFSSVSAATFILFLILLAATFGGVSLYIYKQKAAEV